MLCYRFTLLPAVIATALFFLRLSHDERIHFKRIDMNSVCLSTEVEWQWMNANYCQYKTAHCTIKSAINCEYARPRATHTYTMQTLKKPIQWGQSMKFFLICSFVALARFNLRSRWGSKYEISMNVEIHYHFNMSCIFYTMRTEPTAYGMERNEIILGTIFIKQQTYV